jgi:hypothetical protein
MLGFTTGCVHVEGPESTGFAGNQLALRNSRLGCTTNFINPAAQALFDAAGANNMPLAANAAVLADPTNTTAPRFTPAAGSPLLTGGATPADPFFTSETFIGAFGSEDWTTGWTKITPFSG